MIKAITLAVAVAALGGSLSEASAQSAGSTTVQLPQAAEQVQQEQGRYQITAEELPRGIKQALKSDALRAWQVKEVYRISPNAQDAAAKATYEVLFLSAGQKRAFARYNEDGKTVAGE